MNQKEKGMFDRFLLALGSVVLVPPHSGMPIIHSGRIVSPQDARLDARDSGQEIDEDRTQVRWAT